MARLYAGRSILILLATTLAVSEVSASCDVPSRFWCDSLDIALNCGIYDQCKKHEWSLTENSADPVNFALYYESLCGACQEFITTRLYPAYQEIGSILNLTLVPYGNAQEKQVEDHWVFYCQHGENECVGNLIETCAIAIVKDIAVYFPFINCMESSGSGDQRNIAKMCAGRFPVPIEAILNCSSSSMGNQLEHEMALKTPRHGYVPWIMLNGVYSKEIETESWEDLVKLICDTYKGPKPPACNHALKTRKNCTNA